MKNGLTQKLFCSFCKEQNLVICEKDLCCRNCGKKFFFRNGFIDFAGEQKKEYNFSQSLMEFSPLVFVYEKFWRPVITFPFSDYQWKKNKILEMLELSEYCHVLDLACGPGNFTRLLADKIPGKNSCILGVDLSVPMLKKAVASASETKYSHLNFIRASAVELPVSPGSFDRIHCSGALHLFPSLPRVFQSVAAALRQDGIFAGSTYIKKTSGGKIIKNALEPLLKFHWFQVEELKQLASDAGLTDWKHYTRKQGIVFRAKKK